MADNLGRQLRAMGFRTRTTHRPGLSATTTLATLSVGRTCIVVAVAGYNLRSGRFVMAVTRHPEGPTADDHAHEADFPTMMDAVRSVMDRAGVPATR